MAFRSIYLQAQLRESVIYVDLALNAQILHLDAVRSVELLIELIEDVRLCMLLRYDRIVRTGASDDIQE